MISLTIIPMEPRENVRDYVYRVLYHNIMSVHLVPGMSVSEQDISKILHISRTPVREAFIHLAQDGLVEILPQRGTFVSKINTSLIRENHFMRMTLEREIVKMACVSFPDEYWQKLSQSLQDQKDAMDAHDGVRFTKLDNDMHGLLFEGCQMPHVWQILIHANVDYLRARILSVMTLPEMEVIYAKHQVLLEHIRAHQTEMAIQDINEHIDRILLDLTELKEEYPDYFT